MDNEQLSAKLVSYLEHLEKLTTSGEQFVLSKAPVYFQEYISSLILEYSFIAFGAFSFMVFLILVFELLRRKMIFCDVDKSFNNFFFPSVSGLFNLLIFIGPFLNSVYHILRCWYFPNVVIMEHLTSLIRSF